MKRNISDLLDHCVPEELELGGGAYYDPERIKRLTMERVVGAAPRRKKVRLFRLLAVAASVCALSVSALAVGHMMGAGDLFLTFFAGTEGTLSEGQMAAIDQVGMTFEGGVTCNGATITPVAALADRNVYYLRLRVEAPEGTVLPDLDEDTDGYYQLAGDKSGEFIEYDFGAHYDIYGYNQYLNWLPDEDPADNKKEVVLILTKQSGTDLCFNDNISKTITIHGLWVQSPDKIYREIFSGEFTFDIGLHYESSIVSLDCEGVSWHSDLPEFTVHVNRLELSPLSLTAWYETEGEPNYDAFSDVEFQIPCAGDVRVVLRDGTVLSWDDDSFSDSNTDGDGVEYTLFAQPLDLEQVDHILLNGTRIPVQLS